MLGEGATEGAAAAVEKQRFWSHSTSISKALGRSKLRSESVSSSGNERVRLSSHKILPAAHSFIVSAFGQGHRVVSKAEHKRAFERSRQEPCGSPRTTSPVNGGPVRGFLREAYKRYRTCSASEGLNGRDNMGLQSHPTTLQSVPIQGMEGPVFRW